ncbi:hypothetical protein GCM10010302_26470 [Streptomyces polychromogenes]|uniref:Uncharacterized protein n=1 Tax=Streptomyces polychromogenes TaxID=67342 RepID=A0ABP3EZY2_9ACTN
MRWRLSDTKVDVQKKTRHREAEDTEHHVNAGYFNTPPVHEIPGHVPGRFFSDPQIDPALQHIPRYLAPRGRAEDQFEDARDAALRPAGRYSASSRYTEGHLQAGQNMPAGRRDEYYA